MARYTEDENEGNGGTFVRILEGFLTEKSKTEKPGFVEYNTINPETKDPVKYYIKQYKGGLSGKVTRLERVELEGSNIYGYNLHMQDDDGDFSIFLREDKVTTERLLQKFENIDLDKELLVKVWKGDDGYPVLNLIQDGKEVPQKWNKDNLPQPKKVKGKWSYAEAKEFLYNNTMENIIPQFAEAQAEADKKKAEREENASAASASAGGSSTSDEDIPF